MAYDWWHMSRGRRDKILVSGKDRLDYEDTRMDNTNNHCSTGFHVHGSTPILYNALAIVPSGHIAVMTLPPLVHKRNTLSISTSLPRGTYGIAWSKPCRSPFHHDDDRGKTTLEILSPILDGRSRTGRT